MKRKFGKTGIFRVAAAMATAAVMMAGCTFPPEEIDTPYPGGSTNSEEVVFMLRVPGQAVPTTGTRATDTDELVEEVDVLLFDGNGDFAKHRTGVITGSMTDNNVKFRVYIEPGQYNLVVIANANAEIEALVTYNSLSGKTKAQVLELLTTTYTPSGANQQKVGWPIATRKVPMFADAGTKTITAGMAAQSLNLRRMLARIDVASATTDFTLEEIYLINYNTTGNIAPQWDANGDPVTQSTPAAWLPAGGAGQAAGISNAVKYTPLSQNYEMQIFTFEAAAATNATLATAPCLILKGQYGGASYYYRVDFTTGADSSGKVSTDAGFDRYSVQYMPLLRNYKYTFTVTAAYGRGYSSLAEALASYTMQNNLLVKLLAYDESIIKDIVSDGRNMLGVEQREMTLDWMGEYATNLVFTDYDYPANTGWSIAGFSDTADGAISATHSWLTATKDSDASADPKNCHLQIKALMNATVSNVNGSITPDAARTAYIHLRAGRLDHMVKVTQQGGAALGTVNVAQDLPNCYMVTPGGNVTFPVSKAWYVWASSDLGEPIDPALPLTAELVWQDEQRLIQTVELRNAEKHSQASIYVKASAGKQGNAVVAIKSGGEIKWSWHIWVSDYIPGTKYGMKKLMDRNLGAIMTEWTAWSNPGDYTSINPAIYINKSNTIMGMHYQYGRKDPFPKSHVSEITISAGNSHKGSIIAPENFYSDWTSPIGTNVWRSTDNSRPKTTYDPCPAGWRVPDPEVFGTIDTPTPSGEATGSYGAYVNGIRTYDGSNYPAAGHRHEAGASSGGATGNIYGHGFYWSSSFFKHMVFGYSRVTSSETRTPDRSAFSVRCVKDEAYVAPAIKDEVWARSNVVLKDGKLTFAVTEEDNLEIPANSQGLLFKWGSLFGLNGLVHVQPNRIDMAANVRFRPTGYTGTTVPTTGTGATMYQTIPWLNAATVIGTDKDAFINYYPGVGYREAEGKGDICRYISDKGWVEGRWRIPTQAEFQSVYDATTITSIHATATGKGRLTGPLAVKNFTDTDGLELTESGYFLGAGANETTIGNIKVPVNNSLFFPASGIRNGSDTYNGQYHNPNWYTYAASSSAASATEMYNLMVGIGGAVEGIFIDKVFSRVHAMPVRCIRDGDPKFDYYIRTEEERLFSPDDGAQTVYMRIFTNAPLAQLTPSFVNTTPGFIKSVTVDIVNSRLVIEINDADRSGEVKGIARVSFGDVSAAIDVIGSYHPAPHTGWAGSNIYWDNVNNRLTFDGVGVTTNEKYMGLYFKWGSLVGIDPNGEIYTPGTTPLYFPAEYTGNRTNVAWLTVPFIDPGATVSNNARAYILELHDEESVKAGKGDICAYLTGKPGIPAGKWRVPTSVEFEATSDYSVEPGSTFANVAPNAAYGKLVITSGYRKQAGVRGNPYFPANGYRFSENGRIHLLRLGSHGFYTTASPAGPGVRQCFDFVHDYNISANLNSQITTDVVDFVELGRAVRCVRE